ncbi:hypothetical protein NRL00_03240 [Aeromonas dhakensis]|nr:hypothetical protein [Aeromonas dhakensis]WAF77619.1 hypothetical protein NRL00_03240 [Aeromonas dhakensis]
MMRLPAWPVVTPSDYLADGAARHLVAHHAGGDHGTYAIEGALGQAGQDAAHDQGDVVGAEGRDQVGDHKQHHQCQQDATFLEAGQPEGEQRAAKDDGQGIGGDEVARLARGDPQRFSHLGQDAGDQELRGADGKGTQGQDPDPGRERVGLFHDHLLS